MNDLILNLGISDEDLMFLQRDQLAYQYQGSQFDPETQFDFNMIQQQQQQEQYQKQFEKQKEIQELQNQLLQHNPNMSMQELENAIENHFIQNNQIPAWQLYSQDQEQAQLQEQDLQNNHQFNHNLQELVNRTNFDFVHFNQAENIDKQFQQAFLPTIQNQILPIEQQYSKPFENEMLYNQFQAIQQDLIKINGLQNNFDIQKNHNMIQYDEDLDNHIDPNNQSNATSSNDLEKQNEDAKKRDQNFRIQLRQFYKQYIENISPDKLDEIQKQQDMLCDQIDKEKRKFLNIKKQKKVEKKKKKCDSSLSKTSSSDSFDSSKINEYDDADSTFQSYLFGANSQIDPDNFIQQVINSLKGNDDMIKIFKRFLPDDDDQDKISMQKSYIDFLNKINPQQAQEQSLLLDQNNPELYSKVLGQLKQGLFDELFELLTQYQEIKENRSVDEALNQYGSQIMTVVENYKKYVAVDIQNQYEIEFEKQKISLGIENGNNILNINEKSKTIMAGYVDSLQSQIEYILQVIPEEIIDNYSVSSPIMFEDKNNDESVSQDQQNSEKINSNQKKSLKLQKLQQSDGIELKKQFINKREEKLKLKKLFNGQLNNQKKQDGNNLLKYKKYQKSESSNSMEVEKRKVKNRKINRNLNRQKATEMSEESEKTYREQEENEEEIEENDEDLQEDTKIRRPKDSKILSEYRNDNKDYFSDDYQDQLIDNKGINFQDKSEGYNQFHKIKPIVNELANKYQNAITTLNRQELKSFDSLQKQIRSEEDWKSFIKLFLLYIEGIISQKDFFLLFEDKFGQRLKSDFKKEILSLFQTRENQRRLQSDILKPWNDLENQKFEKIHESSYYKIDTNFPLPICQAKLDPNNNYFYKKLLNDKYLSLSTGSENFKFKIRNGNEDMIFKNEDEMYKLDRQIEMFRKCQEIVHNELTNYYELSQREKKEYEFPRHKLRILSNYWEKKYKDHLIPFIQNKPFKEEHLIQFNEGLTKKLNELQNQKLDQLPQFEDVFKKNFLKSLDHRSILYNKEFIKKFLQKQQHITEIKQSAQQNNNGSLRHINLLKGGNFQDSPFYHSFGNFIKNKNEIFEKSFNLEDYPLDLKFLDQIKDFDSKLIEKLPHSRLLFNDIESLQITIKIMLLHINHSQTHHANDRPRLVRAMKQILVNFMQIQDFDILQKQCQNLNQNTNQMGQSTSQKIEQIKPKQIELIMNQNCHFWYITRCQQIINNKNDKMDEQIVQNQNNQNQQSAKDFQRNLRGRTNGDNTEKDFLQIQEIQPIKIEIQQSSNEYKNQIENLQFERMSEEGHSQNETSQIDSDEEKGSQNKKGQNQLDQNQSYQQLKLRQEENQISIQKQINDSLYLPFFKSQQNSQKHFLLYSPSNVFMFIRFFYALYERIYYSKQLIIEKINQDLNEMSLQEKINQGIINQQTGEINQEIFQNVFVNERYEHLLKGIFATSTQQSFGGNQFQGIAGQLQIIGHGYSHNQQIMDHNKYEDFARKLLGKNAFLLFQIDKIISQAIKQIAQIYSDSYFKKAMKLFRKFNTEQHLLPHQVRNNESTYLTNYTQEIIDQCSVCELQDNIQGQSGKQFTINKDNCMHTQNIFQMQSQKIKQNYNLKNENTNATASNIQNSQLNSAASAIQQQAFQIFRLLWSKESNILSIHYININPNTHQLNQGKNYKKQMQDNFKLISDSTTQPIQTIKKNSIDQNEIECICRSNNDFTNQLKNSSSKIFLERNLVRMQKIRKIDEIGKNSIIKNGLTVRYFTNQNNLNYDVQGEDVFLWQGHNKQKCSFDKRKTNLNINQFAEQDFKKQCQAAIIRAQKFNKISNQ